MNNTSVRTVWTVGSNIAGYSPEGDVHTFDTFNDARQALIDLLTDSVDTHYGHTDCECAEDGDPCEGCSYAAEVQAIVADDLRSLPAYLPYTVYTSPAWLSPDTPTGP